MGHKSNPSIYSYQQRDFAERKNCFITSPCKPQTKKLRAVFVFGCVLILGLSMVGRLSFLQLMESEKWTDTALKQHFSDVEVLSERGVITDRYNRLLAVSAPSMSLYIRPRQIRNDLKDSLSTALARALRLSKSKVSEKLSATAPFVWLARQLPREVVEDVMALSAPGIFSVNEAKRYYPYGQTASTLIGRVGVDGVGLSGMEFRYNDSLQADHFSAQAKRDALGNKIINTVDSDLSFQPPKGNQLALTIDAQISMIMDQEVEQARLKAKSKSAMAVMIDADSGEILGLSQSPQANFNDKQGSVNMKNLVAEMVYEPGSTIKPLILAGAMESGVVDTKDFFNCENGSFRFASTNINDVHPYGVLSLSQILIRSSNIGMTKVGVKLGKEGVYQVLKNFGFGTNTSLGLPGESAGILRSVSNWATVDIATHSFGQGLAVTPLQMVRATAAIVNGGRLPELSLQLNQKETTSRRIISEKVAAQVEQMMYSVVEDEHGTGGKASVLGLRVGGKTGTAQKAREDGRGYQSGAYIASFVGFVDGHEAGVPKKLVMIVLVDEPNTDTIYGGTLAAPVFSKIMRRTLSYLRRQQEFGSIKQLLNPTI